MTVIFEFSEMKKTQIKVKVSSVKNIKIIGW